MDTTTFWTAVGALAGLGGLVVAHDCGHIVYPDGVGNQVESNVVQSASRALKEALRFDATHITSLDWESYPILTFSEMPDIEVVPLDQPGDPAAVTTAPTPANTIYFATGTGVC